MSYNLIKQDCNWLYRLSVSMWDWLSEDYWAWFILDAVQEMDLLTPPCFMWVTQEGVWVR